MPPARGHDGVGCVLSACGVGFTTHLYILIDLGMLILRSLVSLSFEAKEHTTCTGAEEHFYKHALPMS